MAAAAEDHPAPTREVGHARLPRVLIVIPTLGRRPELFRDTIASLQKQEDEPADVVVVVPADAEDVRRIAVEAGATLVDDPGGMSSAINAGFAMAEARHQYANWIGDDDLLEAHALSTAAKALDDNPGAVVAFGYCHYIDEHGRRLFTSRAGRFAPWLMTWGPDLVPQPGALFRTSALRAVGPIDPALTYAMDLDLLLRLRRRGRFVNTRTPLASFRWHASSATVANRTPSLDESQMVKRRHLSSRLRWTAPLWERPVRAATQLAARRVNRLARG